MASTYSNLGIELIGSGEQTGTWGTTTNTNLGTLIDQAIGGYTIVSCTTGADTTITIPNGATGVARNMTIQLSGSGGANTNLIVPTNTKLYFIFNNASGAVTVKVSGQTGVSVPAAAKMVLVCNGTDVLTAQNYFSSLTLGTPLTVANGGSGVAAATAYAVLCGGTTSTGAIQAIASVGTTGQVLTSNGAGALPSMQSSFLTGMIILWYGTVATIPTGWVLCNGSNSTPDLRNKFVIAADADSGGAAKTTVTGTATQSGGSADLVVVSHTHVATDAGHTHLQQSNTLLSGGAGAVRNDLSVYQISAGGTTQSGTANITNAVPVGSVSGTNQNLPPYYALCYIMKS